MTLFSNKKSNSFMNEIRCDEKDYLIWKWHPKGIEQGESNRENSIRWGSSLHVKDGEVAVFVYRRNDGTMQDYIEGPFDQILETSNLPILADVLGIAYAGGTPFPAEVYFVNLAQIIQVKFGVPFFNVFDPRFSDFSVPVAVRGTISFMISDYDDFIKLHRLSSFDLDDFSKQIRDVVCRYVKDVVTNVPAENNIPVVQLESKIAMINDKIEYDISTRLKEQFAVVVSSVDISAIEIDKSSDEYSKLMAITRDLTSEVLKTQTDINIKEMYDKQRIESQNVEETLRIQREEAQYAQRMQTRTANYATYQTEKQAEVGVAGANALGQMGVNGAGSIDLGANSGGINMAAMMASMSLGSTVGQNIASTLNSAMTGVNQTNIVPPPIPTTVYYVAVNGQATGPYDLPTLKQMVSNGQLTSDSLVWKQGMTEWVELSNLKELNNVK